MKTQSKNLQKSEELWLRAKGLIPAGTQTLSKGPTQYVEGVAPKYLKSGKGCLVKDVDGNEYIDYGMGLHPIILGYCYPAVDAAIERQLKDGTTFTLMHPLEVEVAELLRDTIPCAEQVRYGKNGSDATSAAIRLARAYTGRDKIVCCGYHGWHDWYVATTERNLGIPKAIKDLTFTFKYNDIESLKKVMSENKDQVAAVIMEPVGVTEPKDDFLNKVKEMAQKNGAVFIFDEVITGFRFSLGGAQKLFGVTPDLAAFGKSMSNGMPLSCVVGKSEIMEHFNDVFFSLTYGGETLSLAAAEATINELKDKNVIDFVWRQGKKLKDGYNSLVDRTSLSEFTRCLGYPARTVAMFDGQGRFDQLEMKSLVQQELLKRGVLWAGYHAVSFSHTDAYIDATLNAFEESLEVLKQALAKGEIAPYLEGPPVKPVFREVS